MISTSSEPYLFVPIVDRSISGTSAILYDVSDFDVSKILLVTPSGAGPPLARLYLIPKSFLGPITPLCQSKLFTFGWTGPLTTRIMASSQKNATSSLPLPNNVAGGGRAEDAILPYQQLLDSVRGTNLGNQLYDLGVVVSSITANNKEAAVYAFGD